MAVGSGPVNIIGPLQLGSRQSFSFRLHTLVHCVHYTLVFEKPAHLAVRVSQ